MPLLSGLSPQFRRASIWGGTEIRSLVSTSFYHLCAITGLPKLSIIGRARPKLPKLLPSRPLRRYRSAPSPSFFMFFYLDMNLAMKFHKYDWLIWIVLFFFWLALRTININLYRPLSVDSARQTSFIRQPAMLWYWNIPMMLGHHGFICSNEQRNYSDVVWRLSSLFPSSVFCLHLDENSFVIIIEPPNRSVNQIETKKKCLIEKISQRRTFLWGQGYKKQHTLLSTLKGESTIPWRLQHTSPTTRPLAAAVFRNVGGQDTTQ